MRIFCVKILPDVFSYLAKVVAEYRKRHPGREKTRSPEKHPNDQSPVMEAFLAEDPQIQE
jgi:hypothetical protein